MRNGRTRERIFKKRNKKGIKGWEEWAEWEIQKGLEKEIKREKVAKIKDGERKITREINVRQNKTDTDEGGRDKQRERKREGGGKRGENSFPKPARRRVPAVFIWPLTSRPLQSLQDLSLTSRRTQTHSHVSHHSTAENNGLLKHYFTWLKQSKG